VDVFTNPASNVTNPRTGLVTNEGAFVRSRPNPYGTARAEFAATQPAAKPGPVNEIFNQPQTMVGQLPPPVSTPPSPINQSTSSKTWQSMTSGPPSSFAAFGVRPTDITQPASPAGPPKAVSVNEMPSGPTRSYAQFGLPNPQESMFGNFFKDPTPQTKGALPDSMSFQGDYFGSNEGRPVPKVPYPLDRFMVNPIDPVTQSMLPDLQNLPQLQLPNMPWQRDRVIDPNDSTKTITQPNWYDNTLDYLYSIFNAATPAARPEQSKFQMPPLGF